VVKLEDEEIKVRLIGIDTPESVHTDESKNTIYGTYASDYTKNVLSDTTTLYLEFDEDTEDIYGRTLAYVWLKDDVSPTTDNIGQYMLNGILLHDGYDMDKVYEPNDRYAANFSLLRENAEKSQTGLWEFEEFQNLWTEYLKAS
jgi:micrococcal nuclease